MFLFLYTHLAKADSYRYTIFEQVQVATRSSRRVVHSAEEILKEWKKGPRSPQQKPFSTAAPLSQRVLILVSKEKDNLSANQSAL